MSEAEVMQKLVRDFAKHLRERRLAVAVVGDMILDNHIEGVPGGRHSEIDAISATAIAK